MLASRALVLGTNYKQLQPMGFGSNHVDFYRPQLIASVPAAGFSARARLMFGTDSPAYSNRYHRGLFHGKTHGQRKKRSFSMKYHLETQKPNIFKKTLRSDILQMDFKLWLSTKARKCIMKSGSLDNYLL